MASVPLAIRIAPLIAELYLACPTGCLQILERSEHAILFTIDEVRITCVGHCSESSHCNIMVCICTIPVHTYEQEQTQDYIQRVVKLIQNQLSWQQLWRLVERLPLSFDSLDIVNEEMTFQIDVRTREFVTKATIQGGSLVNCDIPHRTDGLYNSPLMALILIQPKSEKFKVRIFSTTNGFVGLHENEGDKKFLSFSNDKGISTKFDVEGMSFNDLEQFLKEPTESLVVIHTTGTSFAGVIRHLEFSIGNSVYIRVGEEIFCIPPGQWTFLKIILTM
jgi:hypothetical protein